MNQVNGLLFGLVLAILVTGCVAASGAASSGTESEPQVMQSTEALSGDALTKQEASTVLKLVDDICGDSWCEGDRNFHFDQVRCTPSCGKNPGTCRLAFRVFPFDSDLVTGPTYALSCETSGFTGFASLIDTAPSGYQSLNWQYYDSLSTCISELESQLPPV